MYDDKQCMTVTECVSILGGGGGFMVTYIIYNARNKYI